MSLNQLSDEELRDKCESYEVIFTETERFWLDTLNSLNSLLESVPDASPEEFPALLTSALSLIKDGYNTIEDTRQKLEVSQDVYDLREEIDKLRDGYDADRLEWDAKSQQNEQYISSLQAELILLRENEKSQPSDWLQKEMEWNQKERDGRVLIVGLQSKLRELQEAQRSWEEERGNGLALLRKLQGENHVLRKESERPLADLPLENEDSVDHMKEIDEDGRELNYEAEIKDLVERHERVNSLVDQLQSSNRRLSTQLDSLSASPQFREDSYDDEIVDKYLTRDDTHPDELTRTKEEVKTLREERGQLEDRIRRLTGGIYEAEDKPLHSDASSANLHDMEYEKLKSEMMEQLRIYNQQQLQALVDRQDDLRWRNNSVGRGDLADVDVDDDDDSLPSARRPSIDDQPPPPKSKRQSNLVRSNTLTEWTEITLTSMKDQMMEELKNLQKVQLESMFKQQDMLRWNERSPDIQESRDESRSAHHLGTKISSKSRQSNLVRNRTKTDWQDSDLVSLKEEMVEELHRIHVEEMERLIYKQDELRLPRPERNTTKDAANTGMSVDQIEQLRDEMLLQLEVITKRELGNMFERQQKLRWAEHSPNPTEQKPPPPQPETGTKPPSTPQNTHFIGNQNIDLEELEDFGEEVFDPTPAGLESQVGDGGRSSNLYRSGTQTEWNIADLDMLKEEMAGEMTGIQKSQMQKMFEEREKLYWVDPQLDVGNDENGAFPLETQPSLTREGPSASIVIHEYPNEENAEPLGLDVPLDSLRHDEEARSPREIDVSTVLWNDDRNHNPPHEIVPRGSGSLSAAIRAGRDLFKNESERTGKALQESFKFEQQVLALEAKGKQLDVDLKWAREQLVSCEYELSALKTSKYVLIEATAKEIDSLRAIILRQSKRSAFPGFR